MLRRIGIVVACCLALVAWAQNGAVGKTAEVHGLVTVSEGNTVRTARNGALVMDGSRVVTSSTGTVRIQLDNGCEINLRPNQSVVIDYQKECKVLIASIQSLDGFAAGFIPGRQVATGVLSILGAVLLFNGDSSSPSTPPTDPGGGGQEPGLTPE